MDPNAMIGPAGYGSSNFVTEAGAIFPYQIDFENATSATAPAQDVTVTDQLDPNLNWATFQLTGIRWGDTILSIPPGSQHYETTVSMTDNGKTFDVLVEAGIHTSTGQVYATFASIDPNTDLPPDVLAGFLPPEDGTGRGEGYVSFSIQPNAGLPTGTQIRNVALITFDSNAPIATDQVSETDPSQGVDPTKQALVTIDAGPPSSHVAALPAITTKNAIAVTWSGTDDAGGSGIASYSIFVSDNGAAFVPWLTATTLTSASYVGQNNHTYGFYSVATDNVGNQQATPTAAQATTKVNATATPPTSTVAALATFSPANFKISWSGTAGTGATIASYTIFVSDNGGTYNPLLSNTVLTSTTYNGVNGRSYQFYSLATDSLGNVQLTPTSAQASTMVDGVAPTSTVAPLPATTRTTSFLVSWSGSDNVGGSGIASYNVYVSADGGSSTLFLAATTKTSATFVGLFGHRYGFYSVATDQVGNSQNAPTLAQSTTNISEAVQGDFDGDGKADLAVYGKVPGTNLYGFTILTSSSNFTKTIVWNNQGFGFGSALSIPIAGDYFGEGKDAYAIFTPDGHGFMLFQAISSVNPAEGFTIDFGLTTDLPVVADVDGDGKSDFGVYGYDANLGYRYDFLLSSRNFNAAQPLIFNNYGFGYGTAAASPIVADFDGSGHAGFGVYIPSGNSGTFTYTNVTIPSGTTGPIINPPASYYFARTYGFSTDIPMAVNYDGDGKADLAFYGLDPRTGRYRYDILTSSTNFSTVSDVYFDNAGLGYGYLASIPVMDDYEGNGHADFAVFQPDGMGGEEFVFQDVGVGHGVVYDFATLTGLPVTAPTFLLAKKVRGH